MVIQNFLVQIVGKTFGGTVRSVRHGRGERGNVIVPERFGTFVSLVHQKRSQHLLCFVHGGEILAKRRRGHRIDRDDQVTRDDGERMSNGNISGCHQPTSGARKVRGRQTAGGLPSMGLHPSDQRDDLQLVTGGWPVDRGFAAAAAPSCATHI